jgi:hypothetical protein
MQELLIAPRFCGPAASGNGGYASGLLAEALGRPVEVTLRAPPPLGTPLRLEPAADGGGKLWADETLVAEARPMTLALDVPERVSWADAQRATAHFIGFHEHPYPRCFVCGPTRAEHDGMRIFPGPVMSRRLVAAAWSVPDDLCDASGALQARFAWAALDCPSWFGYASFERDVPPVLLGRLAATITRAPRTGERCVVAGWSHGREGRRISCGSALYDASGTCVARALSTWVALKAPLGTAAG